LNKYSEETVEELLKGASHNVHKEGDATKVRDLALLLERHFGMTMAEFGEEYHKIIAESRRAQGQRSTGTAGEQPSQGESLQKGPENRQAGDQGERRN
jgi:hypothetical protein